MGKPIYIVLEEHIAAHRFPVPSLRDYLFSELCVRLPYHEYKEKVSILVDTQRRHSYANVS